MINIQKKVKSYTFSNVLDPFEAYNRLKKCKYKSYKKFQIYPPDEEILAEMIQLLKENSIQYKLNYLIKKS